MELKSVASPYCFLEAPRCDGEVLWFTDLGLPVPRARLRLRDHPCGSTLP